MNMFNAAFLDDHFWTMVSASSAVLVLISSVADRRRQRRTKIDDTGFMPWTGITVFAVLATVIAAAFAIKSG